VIWKKTEGASPRGGDGSEIQEVTTTCGALKVFTSRTGVARTATPLPETLTVGEAGDGLVTKVILPTPVRPLGAKRIGTGFARLGFSVRGGECERRGGEIRIGRCWTAVTVSFTFPVW